MSQRKAVGEDEITVYLIKHRGDIIREKLAALLCNASRLRVLVCWKNANLILINKKRGVEEFKNYSWPIILLSVLYKTFTKVISNRIETKLDFNQPREQVGFSKGYSTINHVINQVIEKSAEYNQPLAFIEYEKAFDSVAIPAVMEALHNQGIQKA